MTTAALLAELKPANPGDYFETYNFDDKDIVVWHCPDHGSYMYLDDLCAIHWCGTPETVLVQLKKENVQLPEVLYVARDVPARATLIEIDGGGMEVIRSLAVNWDDGVRFRDWLVTVVIPNSPYIRKQTEACVDFSERAEQEGLRVPSTPEEARENLWAEEQARHRPRRLH